MCFCFPPFLLYYYFFLHTNVRPVLSFARETRFPLPSTLSFPSKIKKKGEFRFRRNNFNRRFYDILTFAFSLVITRARDLMRMHICIGQLIGKSLIRFGIHFGDVQILNSNTFNVSFCIFQVFFFYYCVSVKY